MTGGAEAPGGVEDAPPGFFAGHSDDVIALAESFADHDDAVIVPSGFLAGDLDGVIGP